MKTSNIFCICFSAMIVAFSSCSSDNGPSIDEYPLNYEIKEVKATSNIEVGCMLVDPYGDLTSAARWERIINPYDASKGEIGPNVMPILGQYRITGSSANVHDEIASNIGKIVEWAKEARIDYLITPAVKEHNHNYPDNVNHDDMAMLNILSGRDQSGPWANDGSMKYAIQVNVQNIASQIGCNNYQSPVENCTDMTYNENGETITITQRERVLNFFRSIAEYFNDPTYYKRSGRPVIMLREPHLLHTLDIKSLYADIRSVCISISGMDPYIISEQESWKPVARYAEVMLDGGPDAVMPREMTNIGAGIYERLYMLGVLINENFKLNRQYLQSAYPGIEYIPSISAGYSSYLSDGRSDYPDILPTPEGFRQRCWIAKMHLPTEPMVIIDAFNNWRYGNAIEPTDPNYGKGWGTTYLDIVKAEFKVN